MGQTELRNDGVLGSSPRKFQKITHLGDAKGSR
jgi:hypothetical protein